MAEWSKAVDLSFPYFSTTEMCVGSNPTRVMRKCFWYLIGVLPRCSFWFFAFCFCDMAVYWGGVEELEMHLLPLVR